MHMFETYYNYIITRFSCQEASLRPMVHGNLENLISSSASVKFCAAPLDIKCPELQRQSLNIDLELGSGCGSLSRKE